MRATSWQIEDAEPTTAPVGVPLGGMVSLHFVRSTLLRRWKALAAAASAGLLLGVVLALLPAPSIGTVTLYLAHDTGSDPTTAMATDVTLLRTRAVAQQTIDALGLELTPEELQDEITVDPTTSSIMILTIPAPDDASAVSRARALAETYLAFRSEQLRTRADAVINSLQIRVDHLQEQSQQLTDKYDALVASGVASTEASATLTQRAGVDAQVSTLQQSIEQAALDVSAVVTASRVLDQPAVKPYSAPRRIVLSAASGLVGGTALGLALILVTALTSLRLRRREEVARALGVPVPLSVGRTRTRLPWRRGAVARRVSAVAGGLDESLVPEEGAPLRLALVAASDADDLAPLVLALADRQAARGLRTSVVDLTPRGLGRIRGWPEPGLGSGPWLFRPDEDVRRGAPALSLVGSGSPRGQEARPEPWADSDVVLVVDEVDLGVGVSHLARWADRAVLVVRTGGSTAEALRTTARFFRRGGPELELAVLVGADRADDSSGLGVGPAGRTRQES